VSLDNQNFSMRVGESRLVFFELDVSDGSPFNTAGSSMQWWLSKTPFSMGTDVLVKKTSASGIAIVTNGINVTLTSDDTDDLDPGYYYHELKVFLPGGGLSSAANGTVRLRPSLDMRILSQSLMGGLGGLKVGATKIP